MEKKGKMCGIRFGKEDEGRKRGGGDCRGKVCKRGGKKEKMVEEIHMSARVRKKKGLNT